MSDSIENLQDLLVVLAQKNIVLNCEDNNLKVDAPPGALTNELKVLLKHYKNEIIYEISRVEESSPVTDDFQLKVDVNSRNEPFPLTDIQWAYWMGRSGSLELGNVATHFYFELECADLNLVKFEAAFRQLIERHDMLRGVVENDGQQRILKDIPDYIIDYEDLRNHAEILRDEAVLETRKKMSHQVFKTDQWPLFEVKAKLLDSERTLIHCSWDFINLDAWSLFLLFKEWRSIYLSPDKSLPKLNISYRDYVLAEKTLKQGPHYQRSKSYWWDRIDKLPAAPQLPIIKTNRKQKPQFTRQRGRLNTTLWTSLKAKAQKVGMTPSGVLLAAFSEVLSFWSKDPHFTLNLTLFNRQPIHPEVNGLLGDFTSILLLEVDNRDNASFAVRAARVQKQFLQDYGHKHVSGVEVLREWSKRRGTGMQASMPVVFTSALSLSSGGESNASQIESFGPMVYGISQTPQVYLDVQAMEDKDGVFFNWDAIEEKFSPGVLTSMFQAYCELLENLALRDEVWNSTECVSLPPAQLSLRNKINDTLSDTSDELLHEPFIRQAINNPDAIAISTPNREISYQQLYQMSLQLAEALNTSLKHSGSKLGSQELIAVCMDKGWEQVVAVLGILMAGAAYMPVDPNLPEARRNQYFEQGEVKRIISTAEISQKLNFSKDYELFIVEESYLSNLSTPKALTDNLDKRRKITELAYVIFTSGSTGIPKGVMTDHRGAMNTVFHINRLFNIQQKDKVLGVSSLSFDLSVYDIFGTLAEGATLVLPNAKRNTDPEHWLELIDLHKVTVWNSAPPLMSMLVSTIKIFHGNQKDRKAQTLRLCLLSGDWIPIDLAAQMKIFLPNIQLISLGGATEASVWSIYYPIEHINRDWKSIPYGKPLPNQTMHILNKNLKPCPAHVIGDIYIGGIGLALGYYRDEEKTNRHFITHLETGERLYYTGDIGSYFEDGNIQFLGREDAQVKLNGHRVELGDVTAVLKLHSGIDDVHVVFNKGELGQYLTAYIKINSEDKSLLSTEILSKESINFLPSNEIKALLPQITKKLPVVDAAFKSLWENWDSLYTLAVIRAFEQLQIFEKRVPLNLEDIIYQSGIALRYKRWLSRALKHLEVKKYLVCDEGKYNRTTDFITQRNFKESYEIVVDGLVTSMGFPIHEAQWFLNGAEKLSDILTESLHSAEIYTADETAKVYQHLFSDAYNQLTEICTSIIDSSVRIANNTGKKLSVLEFGAGLGTATSHILPLLAPVCEYYDFTDISDYFLNRAKTTFSEHSFLRYKHYNLDHSPTSQTFETHSYDIILGVSVLHDAKDIEQSLDYLRSLLKPGGLLILLEQTKLFNSFDLNMGLQKGFDDFTDTSLRHEHCLLSREEWCDTILAAGFASSQVLNLSGSRTDHIHFDVIVSSAPVKVEVLDQKKLDNYVLEHLPAYMKPEFYQVLKQFPINASGKFDYRAIAESPAQKTVVAKNIAPPKNSLEKQLLNIWKSVLLREEIGINSPFFDVGGDSLLLVNVRNEIKKLLDISVATTVLFEHSTIRQLAVYLTQDSNSDENMQKQKQRADKQRKALNQRNKINKKTKASSVKRGVKEHA